MRLSPALLLTLILLCAGNAFAETKYADRFVWLFGWNLRQDKQLDEIEPVLATAAEHGLNGAVVSAQLDTLCKKTPEYFERLDKLQDACKRHHLEFIPAVYSIGYGGWALSHNPNLAAGIAVKDAPFVVDGNVATLVPDPSVKIANGGFEDYKGNKLAEYNFHDKPGTVSFVDTMVKHSGSAALRIEKFGSDPHGHGRVMQEVAVKPRRCYRLSLWIKTENLKPVSAFRIQVLAGNRTLAPQAFALPATTDWRKITMVFNSLEFDKIRLYAGVWRGASGRFWLDDWSLEEVGPLNVLHRPGTPVTVRSADGKTTYTQGSDYAPLVDPRYSPTRVNRVAPALKLLPETRIEDGQSLRVSWYHSQVVHRSQITVCMAEPELYEIMDHEAALLAQHVNPRRVLLNMDEIRMGGTCAACRGRNMGELLGECISKQVAILRKHMPNVQIYIWSDMLDPHHNAHGDYYLVEGDFTGSWNHVPKDLKVAVWGREPRPKSLRFFAEQGFETLVACYYDTDNLDNVKSWLKLTDRTPSVRGLMYTPWQRKYSLLGPFGDLLLDK